MTKIKKEYSFLKNQHALTFDSATQTGTTMYNMEKSVANKFQKTKQGAFDLIVKKIKECISDIKIEQSQSNTETPTKSPLSELLNSPDLFDELFFTFNGKLYSSVKFAEVKSPDLLIADNPFLNKKIQILYKELLNYKYYKAKYYTKAYTYLYNKKSLIVLMLPSPSFIDENNPLCPPLNVGYFCYHGIPIMYDLCNCKGYLINSHSFRAAAPNCFSNIDMPIISKMAGYIAQRVKNIAPCIENIKPNIAIWYPFFNKFVIYEYDQKSDKLLSPPSNYIPYFTFYTSMSVSISNVESELDNFFNNNIDIKNKFCKLLSEILFSNYPHTKLNILHVNNKDKTRIIENFTRVLHPLQQLELKDLATAKFFSQITEVQFSGYDSILTYLSKPLSGNNIFLLRKMINGTQYKSGKQLLFNRLPIISLIDENNNGNLFMGIDERFINYIDLRKINMSSAIFTFDKLFYAAKLGLSLLMQNTTPPEDVVNAFISLLFYSKEESNDLYRKFKNNQSDIRPSTKSSDIKRLFDAFCKTKYSKEQIDKFSDGKKNFIINALKENYEYIRPHYSVSEKNCWEFSKLIINPEKVSEFIYNKKPDFM